MSSTKKHVIVEREIGGRTLRFETGKVAKLAHGAVVASYGDTVVLCTAVRANPRAGIDFFPSPAITASAPPPPVSTQAASRSAKAPQARRKS